MHIRRAGAGDLERIVALWWELMYLHTQVDGYFAAADDAIAAYSAYAERNIADPDKLLALCENDGHVVGYILAEVKETPPVNLVRRYVEVMEIAVGADWRREGAGAALLDYVRDWTRRQGIKRLEAWVAVNNPLSQAFWAKQGFRAVAETRCLDLE